MADRYDPYSLPTHANAGELASATRRVGVAQNHVLGGQTYGTLAHVAVRAATPPAAPMTGQATRREPQITSRLPVGTVRSIWSRVNLTGTHSADMPPDVIPTAPQDSSSHGPTCLDCATR